MKCAVAFYYSVVHTITRFCSHALTAEFPDQSIAQNEVGLMPRGSGWPCQCRGEVRSNAIDGTILLMTCPPMAKQPVDLGR